MKINTLIASVALVATWQILTGTLRDPNNPPTARTGAPGETTCGASNCHSGGSYTGTVTISGVPDTIVAGQSYSVTLTNTSNAVRAGFELTCLDKSNVKCGTLSTGAGTSLGTAGGRQYVRQSSPKLLSNGSISWSFTWKAPASITGDTAVFYFVSLAANNNGKNTGDNVLIATKKVSLLPTVAAHEPVVDNLVKVYPSAAKDVLYVDLLQGTTGRLTIFDMQGKSEMQAELVQNNQVMISNLEKGMHLAQITAGGKTQVKKFVVE